MVGASGGGQRGGGGRVGGVRDDGPVSTSTDPLSYGEVFTRRWVVDALLDLIAYVPAEPLHDRLIVEPSVGSGAFLVAIAERLLASAAEHGVDPSRLAGCVRAYDLQDDHVATCRDLMTCKLMAAGLSRDVAVDISMRWVNKADFLLDEVAPSADFVVGNPPYIRADDLTPEQQADYRMRWTTMRGRVDIYIGFFERSLGILKPGARLGFICADRWMRNAYGARLRELVGARYSVETLWQMHDVEAFEEQVSAYPAITVLANRAQGEVVVLDTNATFGASDARRAVEFLKSGESELRTTAFAAHRMSSWFTGADLWPAGAPARIALLEDLNTRFGPLEDPAKRTRIGIGVATGADKVFIVNQDVNVEAERKLPLVMADDIRTGEFRWHGKVLLNPWNEDGTLVRLSDYPRLKAALEAHPSLRARFVARSNPDAWYRTIDKVDPALKDRPKLLLQDMKATIQPVHERGGFYPHHNLYFIVSDEWDLEVLGGLLLSRVAQAFIEAYGVRMRGGTLRFQAQYLRKIRVPRPSEIADDVACRLVAAFRTRDADAATKAAEAAYGLVEGEL